MLDIHETPGEPGQPNALPLLSAPVPLVGLKAHAEVGELPATAIALRQFFHLAAPYARERQFVAQLGDRRVIVRMTKHITGEMVAQLFVDASDDSRTWFVVSEQGDIVEAHQKDSSGVPVERGETPRLPLSLVREVNEAITAQPERPQA